MVGTVGKPLIRLGLQRFPLKVETIALASVAQLVRASSHKSKGDGFNPWSGHMPRLWVQSWSGRMQKALSTLRPFLSLSLCLSLSLTPPSSLSGIKKKCRDCTVNSFPTPVHANTTSNYQTPNDFNGLLCASQAHVHHLFCWCSKLDLRSYNDNVYGVPTLLHNILPIKLLICLRR